MIKINKSFVTSLLIVCLLAGVLWLLHRELATYHLRDIERSLAQMPISRLVWALILTGLSYTILVGYDWVALRLIKHPMLFRRIALASFLGYSASNNFGTLLGGSTIRLRLYTAWGLSAMEIVKLLVVLTVTFWMGLFALSTLVFLIDPLPIPARLGLPMTNTVPLGILCGVLSGGYLVLCAVRSSPIQIWRWRIELPSFKLALSQLVIAALDISVSGLVLYVCMPADLSVSFGHFLAIYLLALVTAVLSHVPGGIGVLELVILVLLAPQSPEAVLAGLLAFRVIYYLIPLALGVLLLGGTELAPHMYRAKRVTRHLGRWTNIVAPRFLSLSVFASGVILLISGATPAEDSRLRWLRDLLPLPIMELSHLLGSVVGVMLLLLARGLQRRIETAYYLVVGLLVAGILFSLLKGFDYEEAIVLSLMLLCFLPSRAYYFRRGQIVFDRLSFSWMAAVSVVILCTVWLMVFAYKHVEYSDELWWKFAFSANAPRSLRAMAAVAVAMLSIAAAHLLTARPHPVTKPTPADIEQAQAIVAQSSCTTANLALLGDKYLLFSQNRKAFIMFGIEGRSWVSLGGPMGEAASCRELIWEFRELCEEGGCWPVFYQVDASQIGDYVEIGMTLLKLGEEARVPIQSFSLDGASRRSLRKSHKHMLEEGCVFEIVPAPISDQLLAELKSVSDAWLGEKSTAEKSFSMGSFQSEYIRRYSIALLRKEGKVMAFSNVWLGAEHEELSVDLMRHLPDAPRGSMEFLFVQLMLWGSQHGYAWFDLGMAPLSGVDDHPMAPLWNRIASFAFRHGENFYNFQGLRQYKEKFDPVWTAKYLASPGGLVLPRILANLATLISGGLRGLVKK